MKVEPISRTRISSVWPGLSLRSPLLRAISALTATDRNLPDGQLVMSALGCQRSTALAAFMTGGNDREGLETDLLRSAVNQG